MAENKVKVRVRAPLRVVDDDCTAAYTDGAELSRRVRV